MDIAELSDNTDRRRTAYVLTLILLLGLGLRLYHVWAAVIISVDSALFIEYARALGEDVLAALRGYDQHPLYPALIRLCHEPVRWLGGDGPGGWIAAGRIVAIAGSLGAILATYWLGTRLYDRRRGLLAAFFLAVLPDACRYGADVLSDLPHLALYLTGLAALLTGMQTRRYRYLMLAAVAAGLAFLVRPEGASVLVVGVIVLLLHRAWPLGRRIGLIVAMVAVFQCCTGPYQLATGKLVPKKSPVELLKIGKASSIERPPTVEAEGISYAASLPVSVDVPRQWFRSSRVVYALLAILGAIVARPRGVGAVIVAAAFGLHLLLLCALESRHGYLDRRHALILTAVSLPVAAACVHWLAGRIGQRSGSSLVRKRVATGIVVFCLAVTARWLFVPIGPGYEHVAASARWLAANTEPGDLIVSDNRLRRVALCADRPFAEWPWWNGGVGHLAKFLRDKSGCYFLVDVTHMTSAERNPVFFEELEERLGPRLELIHSEAAPAGDHPTEIRIYRYVGLTAEGAD